MEELGRTDGQAAAAAVTMAELEVEVEMETGVPLQNDFEAEIETDVSPKDDLEVLIGRIPACCSTTPNLSCCCGRQDCAYLKHNCVALDDLEKEVRTAAQLGQALLIRHEQYMHDAERDRLELSAKIEQLEFEKRNLEDQNAETIRENRGLLDELEGLNGTLSESDLHIKSLEATLQSTRQEIRRLETLALRTHDLEAQLAAIEQEQELLQRTLTTCQEEERCSIQRWRIAERKLMDVNDQLERIERETREERERHVEVVERMERQRAVEKELDESAGRSRGAAITTGNGKSHVVSHFVKDILHDNANLQLGIVELRELLMNSNDEVQLLREQLLMHQPIAHHYGDGQSTLRAEMAPKQVTEPHVISQELHIHHHYHGPKKEDIRRPKKKRVSLNAAIFTPPRKLQSPSTLRSQESANAILSQTSVPSPITPSHNRWSMQSGQLSDFAPSSVPSSPNSVYRHSALFDRGFDMDSSRPTSPTSSVDPVSPQFTPYHHRKRMSEVSTRSFATAMSFQPHVIHEEEDDDVEELPDLQQTQSPPSVDEAPTSSSVFQDSVNEEWSPSFQRTLRHSTSHESILSISGLDIHTLKSRPAQITMAGGNPLFRPRSRLGTASSYVSMETITGASAITARPELSRYSKDSSSYLRSAMRSSKDSSDTRSVSSSGSNSTEGVRSTSSGMGWVFGRWASSSAKTSSAVSVSPLLVGMLAPSTTVMAKQSRAVSTPVATVDPLRAFMGRPPGINQKGPVPGFAKKVEKVPFQVKVVPGMVDHDALREVLGE